MTNLKRKIRFNFPRRMHFPPCTPNQAAPIRPSMQEDNLICRGFLPIGKILFCTTTPKSFFSSCVLVCNLFFFAQLVDFFFVFAFAKGICKGGTHKSLLSNMYRYIVQNRFFPSCKKDSIYSKLFSLLVCACSGVTCVCLILFLKVSTALPLMHDATLLSLCDDDDDFCISQVKESN